MSEVNDHSTRAHAVLSASSSARWLACPPSAHAATLYPNTDTTFTREGTFAHEIAEVYTKGETITPEEAAKLIPEGDDFDVHEAIKCAEGWGDYLAEQRLTADCVTLAEQVVNFSEWVPDGFGTADCIQVEDSTLRVFDYKYGKGVAVSAADNPQMKLYALGALAAFGFVYDIEMVEMHIYQPRINNVSKFAIAFPDLLDWAKDTLAPTAEKAAKGGGKYQPGEHCRFCPHAGKCKALAKTCTEYVQTRSGRKAIKTLTGYEIADILGMESTITAWLKAVRAQALACMMDGAAVPGYKVVEGKPGNRKWSNEVTVMETLTGNGYEMAEITETKLLSPAAMDKALGKAKAAELLAGLVTRSAGAPTIAPATDKRPAYNRADDFTNLEE